MKNGLSRSTLNRTKRYVGVLMQQGRVILDSDWNKGQEDDLGITLLEMWANIADQLSYYQDRIAKEGFLSTASKRLSLSESVLRSVLHTARAVNAITSEITAHHLKPPRCR